MAKTVRLTDHAILRYLQRVHGIDIDAVRREIMTPERIEAVRMGVTGIKVPERNIVLKVRDGAVVTCIKMKKKSGGKQVASRIERE